MNIFGIYRNVNWLTNYEKRDQVFDWFMGYNKLFAKKKGKDDIYSKRYLSQECENCLNFALKKTRILSIFAKNWIKKLCEKRH